MGRLRIAFIYLTFGACVRLRLIVRDVSFQNGQLGAGLNFEAPSGASISPENGGERESIYPSAEKRGSVFFSEWAPRWGPASFKD